MVDVLDARYPPALAAEWDRVGLVVGDPDAPAVRVLFVVDCVPETVRQAIALDVDLIVAHHPLLLRGVSSVATTTYKGRIVHDLIGHGIGLFVAHTNADCAPDGVAEALAATIGLVDIGPLTADGPRDAGRTGRLPVPVTLAAFAAAVATALPPTGVRAAGDPDRLITTVAVCPGAGDAFLDSARTAAVDAYLTADLRHHPASEFLANPGPALVEASHWATERPWLDRAAAIVAAATGVQTVVSDLVTDPWTVHISSPGSVGATDT
ncbi:MAG TPA: Nif3-like dinuclear metal center hexameric protein [Micromonosporaceae bacterium]